MGVHACGIEEEILHNKVIEIFAKTFGPEYEIQLNIGDEETFEFGGYYPDIIAIHRKTGKTYVAEVKTPTFVNREVAENQWEPFSKLGDSFFLIIPSGMEYFVIPLIRTIKVDKLISFFEDEFDQINFNTIISYIS